MTWKQTWIETWTEIGFLKLTLIWSVILMAGLVSIWNWILTWTGSRGWGQQLHPLLCLPSGQTRPWHVPAPLTRSETATWTANGPLPFSFSCCCCRRLTCCRACCCASCSARSCCGCGCGCGSPPCFSSCPSSCLCFCCGCGCGCPLCSCSCCGSGS